MFEAYLDRQNAKTERQRLQCMKIVDGQKYAKSNGDVSLFAVCENDAICVLKSPLQICVTLVFPCIAKLFSFELSFISPIVENY